MSRVHVVEQTNGPVNEAWRNFTDLMWQAVFLTTFDHTGGKGLKSLMEAISDNKDPYRYEVGRRLRRAIDTAPDQTGPDTITDHIAEAGRQYALELLQQANVLTDSSQNH